MGFNVNRRDLMLLLGAFSLVPMSKTAKAQVDDRILVLFCAGVFQPLTISELADILDQKVNPSIPGFDFVSSLSIIQSLIMNDLLHSTSHGGEELLYTSHAGHGELGYSLRGIRDIVRILLLNPKRRRYTASRAWNGLAPWIDDPSIRQLTESIHSGFAPSERRSEGTTTRLTAWAELADTLSGHAGPVHAHLPANLSTAGEDITSLMDLSLGLGVSRTFLEYLKQHSGKQYFEFERTTGNKTRTFHSPNAAVRVVQRYLLNYVLYKILVSPFAHAYIPRALGTVRNAITNAMPHIGQRYLGMLDIEDFFPSISHGAIEQALVREGLSYRFAEDIASLCMVDRPGQRKLLPQGGIASGYISNLVLKSFDELMGEYCIDSNVKYSRYSDDLVFGAASRQLVMDAMAYAEQRLNQLGFFTNQSKRRVIGPGQQKKVTGVVVSDAVRPPKEMRRRVRAMINEVRTGALPIADQKLQGYIAYFRTFPNADTLPVMCEYGHLEATGT